jgi:hypothetical protein
MLRYIYIITSALALSIYGYMALTGHEFGSLDREEMEVGSRHTPGYRSHIWLLGAHGGK